jgi:hypothetical protein
MAKLKPAEVICSYYPKPGRAREFLRLLKKHWPTLRAAGLATGSAAKVLRSVDKDGNPFFVERFVWKDASYAQIAHQTPAVMGLWEPMGQLCKDMTFWSVERVPMPFDRP